ncbi:MAG: AAA family ATPase [Bacteroidia bacterium]|nr:AAA family ATPase [Bacteroidia bacterium]MDW8302355.1 AAA family ATPase [Bacteroidia bacterium]
MKILSIRIRNLHSLRGEHYINFEEEPFLTHSLFAIVGPTGAGKSTILDAITLALYGRVFRYSNAPADKVISFGEKDALAEITFVGKDGLEYAASWAISQRKTGTIGPPKRHIAESKGSKRILAEKEKDINPLLQKIIGLEYEQFTRSIILPQGNFASFLKAKPNERAEILEYITGTEIFSQISAKTYEICTQKERELNQLKDKLQTQISLLLSAEQISEIQQKIIDIEESLKKDSQEQKKLEAQYDICRRIEQYKREIDYLEKQKYEIEQKYKEYKTHFEKYQFYEKYADIYDMYDKKHEYESQLAQKIQEKEEVGQQINALHPKIQAAQEEISKIQKEIETLNETIREKKPIWQKARELEYELNRYRSQIKEIEKHILEIEHYIENLYHQNEQNTQNLECLEEKRKANLEWLQAHQQYAQLAQNAALLQNYMERNTQIDVDIQTEKNRLSEQQKKHQEIEQKIAQLMHTQQHIEQQKEKYYSEKTKLESVIEQLKNDMPKDIPDEVYVFKLRELKRNGELYSTTLENLQKEQKEQEQIQKAIQEQETELDEYKQKMSEYEKAIGSAQNQIEWQKKIDELAPYRAELKKGQPCPLCGATEHPYVVRVPEVLSQLQKQLQDLQQFYQQIREQFIRTNENIEKNKARLKANQNQILIYQKQLAQYEQEFNTLLHSLHLNYALNDISLIQAHLQQVEEQIKTYSSLKQQIETKDKELKKIHNHFESIKNQLDDITLQIKGCEIEKISCESEIKHLQSIIQKLEQDKQQLQKDIQTLYPQYTPSTTFEEVEHKIRQYSQKNEETQQLTQKIETLQKDIERLESQIQQYIAQKDKQSNHKNECEQTARDIQTEIKQLIPDMSADEEEELLQAQLNEYSQRKDQLQSTISDLQAQKANLTGKFQEIERTTQDLQTSIQNLTTSIDAEQSKYQLSAEDFSNYYLPLNERSVIKSRYEAYCAELEQNHLRCEQALSKKSELESHVDASVDAQLLAKQIETIKKRINEYNQELGRHKASLEHDAEVRKTQEDLHIQIQKQEGTFRRWERLNELIGSREGDKFRKFAQGLTLARLAGLANDHLKTLNPRYTLRKKPGENLDLEVIDAYQAGEVREISSLSGGETFLVSLALALGLSQLVGEGTQIRSLFIDEGFGTLDPQTLEVAMTALENLQMTGKVIGIISHVESLKERIHTKIIVEKTAHGTSRIKIYPPK